MPFPKRSRNEGEDELEDSLMKLAGLCEDLVEGVHQEEETNKKMAIDDALTISRETERLREREEHLNMLRKRLKLFVADGADTVELDVGGQTFITTRDTLTSIPDTLFTVLLSNTFSTDKNSSGGIMLDRDPTYFSYILNYLRDCRDKSMSLFSLKGVSQISALRIAQEADFYGLERLKHLAENCTSLVVSKEVDAPYHTIRDALSAAKSGERIVIYPGTYYESIHIDKSIEILGEGQKDRIVIITTSETATVRFSNGKSSLNNISLKEMSRYGVSAVELAKDAEVNITNCDLTTRQDANTVVASDSSKLTMVGCRVHGSRGSAVLLRDSSSACLSSNELTNTACSGLQVRHRASFSLIGNIIQRAARGGVDVHDESSGVISNNSITICKRGAIILNGASGVTISGNVISKNECGIRSFLQTNITASGNRITDNIDDTFGDVTIGSP